MSSRWFSRAGHAALAMAVSKGHRRFRSACANVERAQRARLAVLLDRATAVDARIDPDWSWEQFRARVPVSEWSDWQGMVEKQRASSGLRLLSESPVMRYQPTSGSTSAIKWIPYTQQFLAELDAAIAPWLADLYGTFPGVGRGHHYWSLSWLPTAMRAAQAGDLNDDMGLLSSGKRLLAHITQAVPQDVSLAETSDDSLFMTAAFLVADRQLSALSVWSPTFALGLLEKISLWRSELATVLARGEWGEHARGARQVRCPQSLRAAAMLRAWDGDLTANFFCELWPSLALVSAWDTASAAAWAGRLQRLLPQAGFQGKGLWATEGVITIPQGDRHVLACNSHAYEFEDAEDGKILAPWSLRKGQVVRPLVSTGSGFFRYRMHDLLLVEDFHLAAPCLRFLGRDDGTDLVGEKLSSVFVQSVLEKISSRSAGVPVTVLALQDAGEGKPGYVVLLEGAGDSPAGLSTALSALADRFESIFSSHFHYGLARNLGQLQPVKLLCSPSMRELYTLFCEKNGMIPGNVKIEPLRHWRGGFGGLLSHFCEAESGGMVVDAAASIADSVHASQALPA